MISRLRAWLIDLVREAIRAEFPPLKFVPVQDAAPIVPMPRVRAGVSPTHPQVADSFETMQEAAIKECEVEQ